MGDSVLTMKSLYDKLIEMLVELKKYIMIVEVPVVPKTYNKNKGRIIHVRDINSFLRTFVGKRKIRFLDINEKQ
jgi:hypothetical protein